MKRFLSALSAIALGYMLNAAIPAAANAAAAAQTITITASSSTLFTPPEITVKAGEPVTLKFVSQSGVHGVESTDLGIPATTITPGSTKTVTFTPGKAGTYKLNCTVLCGPDHTKMVVVIKVIA